MLTLRPRLVGLFASCAILAACAQSPPSGGVVGNAEDAGVDGLGISGCAPPDCRVTLPPFATGRGSGGPRIALLARPARDDEIARWGDCVEDVLRCLEASTDGALAPCLGSATRCPDPCLALVRAAAPAPTWADFRAVFLTQGAACAPSLEVHR